jgi:hypothetical protein
MPTRPGSHRVILGLASGVLGRSLKTWRHRGWCPKGPNLHSSAPWGNGSVPAAPGSNIPASTLMRFGQFSEPAKCSKDHNST